MIAWVKESGRFTIDRSLKWTRPDIQDMIDKTRWLLNADFFQKENMSMTSEMVQGHSDVGLRDKLKKSGTEQRLREDMYVFILWDTAIVRFTTKMLMLRFECDGMTGTTLENSENYHVSGFASGSFHAVSTVCPPAPNVERRGSELHLFHQRPDHRLHLTNRVYCNAIGLRVTTCPLFRRNFDVMRRPSRKSTASTACDLRETIRARRFPRPRLGYVTPFKGGGAARTHLCVFGPSLRKTVASSFLRAWDVSRLFTGPCGHCRSQQLATCDVCGRYLTLNNLPRKHGIGHEMAPKSDCELLSHPRSVRSALPCAFTTSCSSCSFTTSTPSSSCITSGTSRAAVPVWRSKMCQSTSCFFVASCTLHRASRWLVEPCRYLGPLSRTVQHPPSTISETEK